MTLDRSIPISLGKPIGMTILIPRNILNLLLILRPVILLLTSRDKLPRTAQETIQPEEIETLQHRQQSEGDDIRDPAFILLRLPVELVGAYGAEFSEQ